MLSHTMKTEDFPVNNILHPITRHSPHHSLEKRLQNSYFEGPNEACGRVIVVRTTPDAARRRPHVPPPCPKPLQPKTCPAPASPAPFTPAVMAVAEGRERGAHRHINRPPQAAWHSQQLAERVPAAGLPVGTTAGTIQMMPHLRNIKELEQPRGQLTKQTKTQQTTKKGKTDGADERRSALTPTMKAAPFVSPRTGPVTTCDRHSLAQRGRTVHHQDGVRTRRAVCHVSVDASRNSQAGEIAAVRMDSSKGQRRPLTADKRGAGPDGAHLGVFEPLEAPRVIRLVDPSGHAAPPCGTAIGVGHARAAPDRSPRAR
jgi:hypothetical protein